MTSAGARDRRTETSKTAPSDSGAKLKPIPFKPRKRIFVILLVIFVIWVVCLLVMYFRTVYPQRHPSSTGHPTSESIP
jgi:hypothetical protein